MLRIHKKTIFADHRKCMSEEEIMYMYTTKKKMSCTSHRRKIPNG